MSRKRLTREQQIERDVEALDDAIGELLSQIGIVMDGSEQNPSLMACQIKVRLDAIKTLPMILERKAKLLGLDAAPGATKEGEPSGIERLTRQLDALKIGN